MKNALLLISICILFSMQIRAQDTVKTNDLKYRRSSLHTVLLSTGKFLNSDIVLESYNKAPFPDKYNDHRLEDNIIEVEKWGVGENKIDTTLLNSLDKDKQKKAERIYPSIIENYFKVNKTASKLVAKWFDRQPNGDFDMQLIHERGSYDASAMQVQIAKGSIRGVSALKDAGEELIKNTFVVVHKMNFVSNEAVALAVKATAFVAAEKISNETLRNLAIFAAEAAYELTKDGYSVWTVSYLYQLDWNAEIANDFYINMWVDKNFRDSLRPALFDNSEIFKLKYIGYQKAKSVVLVGAGKSFEDVIQMAAIRNIDKVYTKLQKEYDVFKTKTPIFSTDPIIAKIGLKEGLEKGDKFDVLEQVYNQKTGLTTYKKVSQVKVDKKNIWDNQFNLENLQDVESQEKVIEGSIFSGGGKKIQPGMLLRQVK